MPQSLACPHPWPCVLSARRTPLVHEFEGERKRREVRKERCDETKTGNRVVLGKLTGTHAKAMKGETEDLEASAAQELANGDVRRCSCGC